MRADSRSTILLIGLLTLVPPLALDLYLPALPQMTVEFETTTSATLATVSACFAGFCIGQLVIGSVSDRVGRRLPLLVGLAGFSAVSFACAVAPTIEVLIAMRVAQGVAGSAALVLARAIVRDVFSGVDAARAFSTLGAITVVVPILGPPLGGALLLVMPWRGLFVVLGVAVLILTAVVWLWLPDTLNEDNRVTGGISGQVREFGVVLSRPIFVLVIFANGSAALCIFTYISMSPHVLQGEYGLSAQAYSAVFAVGALGMLVATQLNRLAVIRGIAVQRIAVASVAVAVAGSALFVLLVLVGAPSMAVFGAMYLGIFSHGATVANMFAIGLANFTRGAGTASAVLGATQFAFGAGVPPLVSLAGTTAMVMGMTMATGAAVALALLLGGVLPLLRRRGAG